jgi:uncharacterized protein YprB with RNaseH-like and TPR domain
MDGARMLSDRVRAGLSQLSQPPAAPRAVSPWHKASPPALWPEGDAQLEDDPAAQLVANRCGEHLLFARRLSALLPGVEAMIEQALDAHERGAADRHPELAGAAKHLPRGTLFLDLETCGFAGSPVFLVGLVRSVDGVLVAEQLFARHYGEERAVLATLWELAEGRQAVVSFNGKSFDWPMLVDRSRRHLLHRQVSTEPVRSPGHFGAGFLHCDLLHHARRRWKRLLPDCKLQTLEQYVCRRHRRDDLPGALVPAAYHDFVRTGRAHHVRSILLHNALDLATLVELACVLLRA